MADAPAGKDAGLTEAERSEEQYEEEEHGEEFVAVTELRAGALRLPSVLMQAITNVSPAAAVFFTFGFTLQWVRENKVRAFDIGIEAGGDTPNFSFGYRHDF